MAIYLDSAATGLNDGSSWANAYTDNQTAFTAWVSGEFILMDKDHQNTSATALSYTGGTASELIPVFRVNKATGAYTPSTGSDTINIETTGANAHVLFESFCLFGVHISINGYLRGSTGHSLKFIDCYEVHTVVNQGHMFGIGNSDCAYYFENTTIDGGTAGLRISGEGSFSVDYNKCTFKGAVGSAGLIGHVSNRVGIFRFRGCDMSGITNTSLVLCDTSNWGDAVVEVDFIDTKFPTPATSFAITDGTFGNDDQRVEVWLSDGSGDDLYNYYKETYRGTVEDNTTTYFNGTGAWVDEDQSTNLSYELIPKSTCHRQTPIIGPPMRGWVSTTGTYTITIEVWDAFTTALQDDEVWLKVSYLDGTTIVTSLNNTRVFEADTPANLTTGAGAASWTGEPAGRSAKLVASGLTIGRAGPISAELCLGKYEAGKSLFYNPRMIIS